MPVTMETGSRYTGLVHRQWSLSFSLCRSLSLAPSLSALLLYPSFTQFSLSLPLFLSCHILPFFLSLALIFIHSCQSSLVKVSPSSLSLALFIQSDVFYLSLSSFMSTLPPSSHISVSLSFHHPLRLSRHRLRLFPFIHLCLTAHHLP